MKSLLDEIMDNLDKRAAKRKFVSVNYPPDQSQCDTQAVACNLDGTPVMLSEIRNSRLNLPYWRLN